MSAIYNPTKVYVVADARLSVTLLIMLFKDLFIWLFFLVVRKMVQLLFEMAQSHLL